MIGIEEYQLNYDLFLAEQELFENMTSLECEYVNESIGIITLNEGFKETIMGYLNKIIESLGNAWEKFKESLTNVKDMEFIKNIESKIKEANPKFVIENAPDFDMEFLKKVKVIPLKYGEMKDNLESAEKFTSAYYSQFIKDNSKSLKENILSSFIKSRSDKQCTKEEINGFFGFVKNVANNINDIKNDISSINASSKEASNIASTAAPQDMGSTNDTASSDNEKKDGNDDKVSYKDQPGQEVNNGGKTVVKKISVYMKVSTEIISAKMKCYKEIFVYYLNTLKHCFGKEKDEEKKEKTETSSGTAPQVNIK